MKTGTKILLFLLYVLCQFAKVQSNETCDCKNRTNTRVALVTYGDHTMSEEFGQIRAGFLEAAKLLRIQPVPLQGTPDQFVESLRDVSKVVLDNLDQALSLDPPVDAIILGITDLDALSDPLKTRLASRPEVYVTTLGAGGQHYSLVDRYNTSTYLPLLHIGVDHLELGETAGVQACRGGAINAICVIHLLGDSTISEMCTGFEAGFKSVCPKASVYTIYAPTSNEFTAKQNIRNQLQSDSNINTVVVSSGDMASIAFDVAAQLGQSLHLVMSMVSDSTSRKMLNKGSIQLVIEHKHYLAAFFATVISVHAALTGMSLVNSFLNTGFQVVSGSEYQPDVQGVSQLRIEQVVHGLGNDGFWKVYKDGAIEAARDLGIQFVTCNANPDKCLQPGTLTYRAPESEFDLTSMAAMIDLAARSHPDAMLVSLPNYDALSHAIEFAVFDLGIHSICVNNMDGGLNVIPGLNHLVAQDEGLAGFESGRMIASHGATKVVCVNPEQGNIGWEKKCSSAIQGLASYRQIDVLEAGTTIVAGNGDSLLLQQVLVPLFENDPQYNAVISNPSTTLAARAVLNQSLTNRNVLYGTHDITKESLEGLESRQLLFAVEQQQNLQSYYSVWMAGLEALTGQTFETPWVLTGPKAATPEGLPVLLCRDVATCTLEEEFETFDVETDCLRTDWIGDGWCDDVNNKPSCSFDGGDCCPETCSSSFGSFACGNDTYNSGYNRFECLDVETTTGLKRYCAEYPEHVRCIRDDLQRLSNTEVTVLVSFATVIVTTCFVSGVIIARERSPIIFFANQSVLITNTIGVLILTIQTIIAATIEHNPKTCQLEDWLIQTGYCFVFWPVYAKMGSIYRIFGNKTLSMIKPKQYEVLSITAIGIFLSIVLINLVHYVLAPYHMNARLVNECSTAAEDATGKLVGKLGFAALNIGILLLCYYRVLKLEKAVPMSFKLVQNDVKVTKLLVYHTGSIGTAVFLLMEFLTDTLPRRRQLFLQNMFLLYFALFVVVVNNVLRLRECYIEKINKIVGASSLASTSPKRTNTTSFGGMAKFGEHTTDIPLTEEEVGSERVLPTHKPSTISDRLEFANHALQQSTLKLEKLKKALRDAESEHDVLFSALAKLKSDMILQQRIERER